MKFDDLVSAPENQTERGLKPQRGRVLAGGLPTVSLLPPEIRDAARGRVLRLAMIGLVVVAAIGAGGVTALGAVSKATAEQTLAARSAETGALTTRLAEFADVVQLESSVTLGRAAVEVGTSTEVDWDEQLGEVLADMPYAYTLKAVTADSASPMIDYPQGVDPLELPRAATMQLTVQAPTVSELSPWLRELRAIPAYADATASYDRADLDGYTVTILLHLDKDAIVREQVGSEQGSES